MCYHVRDVREEGGYGRLGNGTTVDKRETTQVSGLTSAEQVVAARAWHVCAAAFADRCCARGATSTVRAATVPSLISMCQREFWAYHLAEHYIEAWNVCRR